jgi:endonuclease YncB( thermonuclease family)
MARVLHALCAATLTAALALIATPSADAAWKAPCIAGTRAPTCYFWDGKVTFVADGDTIAVDVSGDGTAKPERIRFVGINAMEQSVYAVNPANRRGECHALEATARLEQLINAGGRVVRLSAQTLKNRGTRRLRRSVAVKLNGSWRDLGQILVGEGHVLWDPDGTQWAHNSRYSRSAQRAAAAGRGLWDMDYCGVGPEQANRLKMWVNWDADGTDGKNPNGEWARIKTTGTTDLPIGGWWFRDGSPARYTFPSGAVIPAGGAVTLYLGSRPSWDTNTATHFYWGRRPIFQNVAPRSGLGDGGYLFDREGDARAWMIYPCRHRCGDPLRGKVKITARPKAPEVVYARNVSTSPVDLEGYVVENRPYVYSFGPSTIVNPGEALKLIPIGSPARDTRLVKHWGKGRYILNDGGDSVRLRAAANVTVDCHAWGSARC